MVKGDQFEVEKIVKNSGSSFYWGMKILPNKQARAMFAASSSANGNEQAFWFKDYPITDI